MNSPFDQILKFETTIGLPKGFYYSLLKESDWGFIIKLHSLFEASASHVLSLQLGNGCLEEAFSHLDFSHSKYGKTKLLKNLGAINSEQAKFLRWLSEIRNEMVHKIKNVSFDFELEVSSYNKDKQKSFCNTVGYISDGNITISNITVPRDQFILENPKLSVWLTASDVLACICLEEEYVELDRQKRELEIREINLAKKIRDMASLVKETKKGADET
jgi:hypothetical protein